MLANKTRIRDGRGRPRKRTLEARKAPGQARSKETVNVILEASARILEWEGLHGFNTNAVAAKAGVRVGSLYQYFPNKDAILLALINSFEDTTQEAILQALQSGKGRALKPCLRLFVHALVVMHYRRPKLNRVLEAEEERLGAGQRISPSVRACVIFYKNTRTKSQRRYPERPSVWPWRFCGRWSIKASQLARVGLLLSGKPCVP